MWYLLTHTTSYRKFEDQFTNLEASQQNKKTPIQQGSFPALGESCHTSLQTITEKILLQYVFANVSSDDHFGKILLHTSCKKKVFCLRYVLPHESSDDFHFWKHKFCHNISWLDQFGWQKPTSCSTQHNQGHTNRE